MARHSILDQFFEKGTLSFPLFVLQHRLRFSIRLISDSKPVEMLHIFGSFNSCKIYMDFNLERALLLLSAYLI